MLGQFDPLTLTIWVEDGLCIGPDLHVDAFLASEVGKNARPRVFNGPWRSWSLGVVAFGEAHFYVSLFFHQATLANFILERDDSADWSPTSGWSKEREEANHRFNVAWLGAQFGDLPHRSINGKAAASFSKRDEQSCIVVRFPTDPFYQ